MVRIEGHEPTGMQVLRPRRRLITRAVIAGLALLLPLSIVLYWLAIPRDTWLFVLLAQCGVLTLGVLGAHGAHRLHVKVDADGLQIRRLLGRVTHFPLPEIDSLLLIELYQSNTLEVLPQLYLLDSSGKTLLHLRGEFWPGSAMERIVDALDVPVERLPDPISIAELKQLRPRLVRSYARGFPRFGF